VAVFRYYVSCNIMFKINYFPFQDLIVFKLTCWCLHKNIFVPWTYTINRNTVNLISRSFALIVARGTWVFLSPMRHNPVHSECRIQNRRVKSEPELVWVKHFSVARQTLSIWFLGYSDRPVMVAFRSFQLSSRSRYFLEFPNYWKQKHFKKGIITKAGQS
jgi:hypothetical protein